MSATAPESPVSYEKRGHVAYVTLTRPAVLNAMNLCMHERLREVWDDFERDESIWVGVLSGAGQRSFSVGQDLREWAERLSGGEQSTTFGSRGAVGWPRLTERFSLSKPLIARVNGHALGGGFELALACDIVLAADHATFALPEVRRGLIAGAGGIFRLSAQIPFKAAMGYLLTGKTMTAARAYELGLVSEVVPMDQLDDCVERWVGELLECAPLSVRAVKEAALRASSLSTEQAFATRYVWEERRMHSHDAIEGPLAFTEKRSPQWRGK
ncbi:enoyl-CoA-hydratase DpgD [Embleya sp. NBC_00896]|uniref:enoyl-CoA-hydratase DpgD n=1 Tax=Embleya sp. NBC_00896 TaxID=2975961 RepID=UPI002F90830D|nr:enoyl-CoA hydratase-related protein [Embleya sp. NBC_00896]